MHGAEIVCFACSQSQLPALVDKMACFVIELTGCAADDIHCDPCSVAMRCQLGFLQALRAPCISHPGTKEDLAVHAGQEVI
jgi:hypothetical protein